MCSIQYIVLLLFLGENERYSPPSLPGGVRETINESLTMNNELVKEEQRND